MLTIRSHILVGVVLLATYTSAAILKKCVQAEDRVADAKSCSLYHICRADPDSPGNFFSDIATCPSKMVFDMVTSKCEVKKGYLQDPAGCNTFYGCRLPSENSEGYERTRYECPGGVDGLRFDPDLRLCNFKTTVPDTKCNSHVAVQAILGQQESDQPAEAENSEGGSVGEATQSESASSTQTGDSATAESESASGDAGSESESASGDAGSEAESASSNQGGDTVSETSGTSEDPASEAPKEETEAPAVGEGDSITSDVESPTEAEVDPTNAEVESPTEAEVDTTNAEVESPSEVDSFDPDSSTNGGTVFRVVTPGERPAKPLTDIDKIAQVIKGQLLTRRKASEVASKL